MTDKTSIVADEISVVTDDISVVTDERRRHCCRQINVVTDDRLYPTWTDEDVIRPETVSSTTGLIAAKRALNKLHIELAQTGFTQVYTSSTSYTLSWPRLASLRYTPSTSYTLSWPRLASLRYMPSTSYTLSWPRLASLRYTHPQQATH